MMQSLLIILRSAALLAEFAVAGDETPDHRRNDPLDRKRRGEPGEPGVDLGIILEFAHHLARYLERELDRLVLRDHSEPELGRSEEHTSELQSLMRISYAVFCLKKKNIHTLTNK